MVGPMILDHRVGLQHVGPDLPAPGDLALLPVELLHLLALLVHLQFVQFSREHLHRAVAVLVLGSLGLTGHDHARGQVRQADRGIRLVHVLSARAARAIGVHAQVALVDLDLDIVVHFRDDIEGHERGVAPLVRVERADAHQAMDAAFRAQVAVGVRTADEQRDVLDARFLAGEVVHHAHLVAVTLAVSPVHAEQHVRPVAGFRAARPGVQAEIRVAGIEASVQQRLDFELREFLVYAVEHRGAFLEGGLFLCRVRLRLGEFVKHAALLDVLLQRTKGVEYGADGVGLADDLAGLLLVVPELGRGGLGFELAQEILFARDVKDNLAFPRGAPSRLRSGLPDSPAFSWSP
ncbi:MAG: hypothetical protein BWY59_01557 [Verrucomicrobia bacterium ADurb.Bin345]|nr:MAG: hypothetical protein BWY59_01557 [Verrucomicrobia bacterium ADurb.Bin345]